MERRTLLVMKNMTGPMEYRYIWNVCVTENYINSLNFWNWALIGLGSRVVIFWFIRTVGLEGFGRGLECGLAGADTGGRLTAAARRWPCPPCVLCTPCWLPNPVPGGGGMQGASSRKRGGVAHEANGPTYSCIIAYFLAYFSVNISVIKPA